jgi:hypothetical protein
MTTPPTPPTHAAWELDQILDNACSHCGATIGTNPHTRFDHQADHHPNTLTSTGPDCA